MKKHIAMVLTVILLLTTVFTGCGSKTTETSATDSGTTTQEVAATNEDQVTEVTEVTLNLLIAQPRFRDQYEAYLDAFVAKYLEETGVKVTYELEMPGADTADEILKTRLSTGDNLDVFMIHAINDKAQYDKAGYLEDLSNEPWVSTLYDSAKEAVTIDGKTVALPLESLTWGMLYNKDMFEELGIKPALTLSEMKTNIDAIKAAGKTPFLASYNEAWIPQLFLPLTTGAFVNTTNKTFLADMAEGKTSYSELGSMFDVIDLVHENANTNGLEIGGSDGCAEFANGEYGMWVQGPWFSATILEANPDFNLGVAPLPVSEDPNQALINASVSTSLAVNALSKNKEAAKALVAYFLNPETSTGFFTEVQFNPLSTVHDFQSYPWIDEAIAYMEEGKAYVDPSIPSAVKDESGKMLQAYYADSASKEDVIEALDQAWATYNEINQ